MILAEYDRVSEVYEAEEDYEQDVGANQKVICYYVMNNSVVEENRLSSKGLALE